MNIKRRDILKLGLVGSGVLWSNTAWANQAQAATIGLCDRTPLPPNSQSPGLSPSLLGRRFEAELPIPKALSALTKNGIDYYEVTMRQQTVEILPAKNGQPAITAKFWTYNNTVPGPLIRQTKNKQSCIRFINELGQDPQGKDICTSIHLHGMASLPQYDGYAEDLIPPGHYKDYFYPNNRPAILWYHDHAVHKTSRNAYMGLAGMYIVEFTDQEFADQVKGNPLPKGEFEIPLVIQDKTFKIPQGSPSNQWELVFNDRRRQGVYADVMLVNGVMYPHLSVKRRKYYFRILNASTSRTYQLTLSPSETAQVSNDPAYQFTVVGGDAGLLGETATLVAPQALRIGVAERYGIVIDFAKIPANVKQVYLKNLAFPGNLGTEPGGILRFDLLDGAVANDPDLPNPLGRLLDRQTLAAQSERNRTFRFGRGNAWTINGRTWSSSFVAADPGCNKVETWTLVNTGGWTHPVHIHLIDFRILDRNGRPPLPYESGFKDVVLLNPLESVRVVARFGPERGKYMMHCHNLVHEDHDMMTQFEVGEKGDDPLSDPAKPLPAPLLGSTPPPSQTDNSCPKLE
jgi:FtsP/CotA-like multicopper oxidase with cupredoxin domain